MCNNKKNCGCGCQDQYNNFVQSENNNNNHIITVRDKPVHRVKTFEGEHNYLVPKSNTYVDAARGIIVKNGQHGDGDYVAIADNKFSNATGQLGGPQPPVQAPPPAFALGGSKPPATVGTAQPTTSAPRTGIFGNTGIKTGTTTTNTGGSASTILGGAGTTGTGTIGSTGNTGQSGSTLFGTGATGIKQTTSQPPVQSTVFNNSYNGGSATQPPVLTVVAAPIATPVSAVIPTGAGSGQLIDSINNPPVVPTPGGGAMPGGGGGGGAMPEEGGAVVEPKKSNILLYVLLAAAAGTGIYLYVKKKKIAA